MTESKNLNIVQLRFIQSKEQVVRLKKNEQSLSLEDISKNTNISIMKVPEREERSELNLEGKGGFGEERSLGRASS